MKYEMEDKGTFTMIHIIGNIDTEANTKRLDKEIYSAIKSGKHNFVFNLERTAYLDSAGISIFIHCLCDVQENNGSVYIIAQDNQVRRVLEMVGINRLIKIYDDESGFLREHQGAIA
ncbi:MAG TPA: STAS domain-containing protein [Chitinivibrionales bacterium]|jgi:anti-anti-sigma factor